jgi:hypothetical protein
MLILLIILLILFAVGGLGYPAYSGTGYNNPISLILWVFVILLIVSLFFGYGPWQHQVVL